MRENTVKIGFGVVERKGIEPSTFALRTRHIIDCSMGYVCYGGSKRAFSGVAGAQLSHSDSGAP